MTVETIVEQKKIELGLTCDNKYKALSAGFVASYVGLDSLFPYSMRTHWALAGVAADLACTLPGGEMSPLSSLAGCALGGYIGGQFATYVMTLFATYGIPIVNGKLLGDTIPIKPVLF